VTQLTVTINGRAYGPREVRDELSMNDFLREYLGMTGTKFGCGAAQCLSCASLRNGLVQGPSRMPPLLSQVCW
jgi:aerobic-type carbon monoxide dehydrogenase small subunit (CoxS/CutS family)